MEVVKGMLAMEAAVQVELEKVERLGTSVAGR
jgi:hypothetical protein